MSLLMSPSLARGGGVQLVGQQRRLQHGRLGRRQGQLRGHSSVSGALSCGGRQRFLHHRGVVRWPLHAHPGQVHHGPPAEPHQLQGLCRGEPLHFQGERCVFFNPRDTDKPTARVWKRRLSGARSSTFVIAKNCHLLCHSLLITCFQQHILASCCCGSRADVEPNWRVQHHFWTPAHFEPSLPLLARQLQWLVRRQLLSR